MATERKKLRFIGTGEIRTFKRRDETEGKLLKVCAEDLNSHAVITYAAFNEKFFDLLKEGAVYECDIEGKQNGEHYDYTINQVYVDGQPVAGKKGTQFRDNSDQVRAQCITQLRVAGVIDSDSPLYKKLYAWCDQLGTKPAVAVTPAVKSAPAPAAPANGKAPAGNVQKSGLPIFETAGKLLTYYTKEKGMSPADICKKLGIKSTADIKDLTAAVTALEAK